MFIYEALLFSIFFMLLYGVLFYCVFVLNARVAFIIIHN